MIFKSEYSGLRLIAIIQLTEVSLITEVNKSDQLNVAILSGITLF